MYVPYILNDMIFIKKKTLEEKTIYINEIKKNRETIIDFLNGFEDELDVYESYSKETKLRLHELAEILLTRLFNSSCWAHHCILKGLKKDLIKNMKLVCLRTRESLSKNLEYINREEIRIMESIKRLDKLKEGRELLKRVLEHPDFNDFKDGFDQRQWECMVDLIETGYVSEDQLPEYGITLNK